MPGDIALLNHHQLVVSDKDSWFWKHTRSGIYSVKRGYDLALLIKNHSLINEQSPTPSINPLKAKVWSIKAPSKIKVFISKALSNALTFNDSLRDRGMKCDEVFQICGMAGEYINHLLFVCSLARQILAISGFPSPAGGFHNCSLFVNLNHLFSVSDDKGNVKEITRVFPWTLWYIWKTGIHCFLMGSFLMAYKHGRKQKRNLVFVFSLDQQKIGKRT